jgi:hypothetical protein
VSTGLGADVRDARVVGNSLGGSVSIAVLPVPPLWGEAALGCSLAGESWSPRELENLTNTAAVASAEDGQYRDADNVAAILPHAAMLLGTRFSHSQICRVWLIRHSSRSWPPAAVSAATTGARGSASI